jgi:hypothetical protein
MINPMRTVHSAILGLGLLGAGTLSALGPLSAHAGNVAHIQITAGDCSAIVSGSGITQGGQVDAYVRGDRRHVSKIIATATPNCIVSPRIVIRGVRIW